jgi:DNA polymerase
MNRVEQLTQLHQKLHESNSCKLKETATQPVFGNGNPNSQIVFIGEAPGKKEDETGIPFVGAAGKFLAEMLQSIGMKREDIYITNIVKYRPPNNRDPEPGEKKACADWLKAELEFIKPKLIVFLGRHSMSHFFPHLKISEEF